MNYWTQSKDNIFVAGHRGFSEKYPENTMESMEAAVELGVDQLETDIRVTKDGELVLHHDYMVDRTTNGEGHVRDLTLEQLRKLDAGCKKSSRFKGVKIPTFIEFMDFVSKVPNLTVNFEFKEYPRDWKDDTPYIVADKIIKIIEDYNFADRAILNSFSPKIHEYIVGKYGKKYKHHVYYPVASMLGGEKITLNPYEYAYSACMYRGFWSDQPLATKEECDMMWSRGVQPWAPAEVSGADGVEAMIERGYPLVTCNDPETVLNELRKRGKHK